MIIILTNQDLNLIPNNSDILVIDHPVILADDMHINDNGNILEFDYLIAYDASFLLDTTRVSFVKDGQTIITNWVGQTSIENIYIGNFEKAIDDLWN